MNEYCGQCSHFHFYEDDEDLGHCDHWDTEESQDAGCNEFNEEGED